MSYMISNFTTGSTYMALLQPSTQTFSTTAGTYQINIVTITQTTGMGLSLSGGAVVLPAGQYVAFFKADCRNQNSSNDLSYVVDLKLNGVIVSQLSAFSEMTSGTLSKDSTVSIGGAQFTATAGQLLSMSMVKVATLSLTETFASYTGIVLIKVG